MGPGDRFKFSKLQGWGLGVYLDRFPYDYSINISLLKFCIFIGLGKSYLDRDEVV